jgi:TPP-dependent pyruvate/acetoin dehydrogenase alpha subunit
VFHLQDVRPITADDAARQTKEEVEAWKLKDPLLRPNIMEKQALVRKIPEGYEEEAKASVSGAEAR